MSHDHDNLTAIVSGDKKAFKAIYELYSSKVYNTALSYMQDQHAAEEVTQDVFMKIHKSAAGFNGESKVGTWIYRIAVNTSLNYLAKKKRLKLVEREPLNTDVIEFYHPGVDLEKKEQSGILFQVIDTLSENQKTAFILSYVEDLPRQEVADVMEVSLKAVESLLQRGKANLRTKLINLYPNRRN